MVDGYEPSKELGMRFINDERSLIVSCARQRLHSKAVSRNVLLHKANTLGVPLNSNEPIRAKAMLPYLVSTRHILWGYFAPLLRHR